MGGQSGAPCLLLSARTALPPHHSFSQPTQPIGRHFILPRAAAPRPAAGRRANGAAAKQATVPALAAPSQKQLERLFKWNGE